MDMRSDKKKVLTHGASVPSKGIRSCRARLNFEAIGSFKYVGGLALSCFSLLNLSLLKQLNLSAPTFDQTANRKEIITVDCLVLLASSRNSADSSVEKEDISDSDRRWGILTSMTPTIPG
jgi:hypothetical protein